MSVYSLPPSPAEQTLLLDVADAPQRLRHAWQQQLLTRLNRYQSGLSIQADVIPVKLIDGRLGWLTPGLVHWLIETLTQSEAIWAIRKRTWLGKG
jgi:hypothetical protein